MKSALLLLPLLLAGCAAGGNRPAEFGAGPIDTERLSQITRTLASDAFEGRAPGTVGEAKTIAYLSEQFRQLGLEPAGDDGTFVQRVPLIRTQLERPGRAEIARGGDRIALRVPDDIYLSTVREVDRARIAAAPMVFVGYGVSAPERQWDDFKGVDLKGKVAVFLVNDPDFEAVAGDAVAGRFGGRAMTYYGRWSYKFEEAARRGAIAALVVHETDGAGYGWNTVQAPGGENYNIVLKPGAQQPVLLQGWIQRRVTEDLFRRAGLDFEAVKRQARTSAFKPIDLGARLDADFSVATSRVESHNVLAKVAGAKRPDETIWFAGHWDAYGIGAPDAEGRRVRPGALDDALGLAGVIEIARAFKAGPRPDRTLVFAAWTAEERGLLGAESYSANPKFPMAKAVANLTLDTLQPNGPARDVVLIGQGQNDLEDRLARAADGQGRTITADAKPERGLFYRADHFAFARKGVPTLLLMALGGGVDLVDGGRTAGDRWVSEFTANCYHQTCDSWSPDWDLRGAAQDISLLYTIGRELAFGSDWPAWKQGSEFAGIRQQSEAERR
ncbi:M20/M25/M40 family metallo-hydrolase [Sphingosinicella sp. BN140058]|uniref:M20/M25/M40 family metallo-hydrolase n=1 Tax=Sphingosinicella sp. BN140058 TaxID=1892855 RepID=UPI001012B7FA|nr:M20/M25/M40 family metallo-hydrolase [Sphingosinicella sp. BN140058]QAY78454.1 M20/M25/M40 family metallo-hydrolase [Sphingosinicella sp. BN140058]